MKHRNIYIIISIVLSLGALFIIFRSIDTANNQTNSSNGVYQQESLSPKEMEVLHPLADAEKRLTVEKQKASSWEEWVEKKTEISLGRFVEWGELKTPAEVETMRKIHSVKLKDAIVEYRKTHPLPKNLGVTLPMFIIDLDAIRLDAPSYQGPQTPEALIEEFDAKYLEKHPESTELTEHFSKEAFLKKFLDKGYRFNEYVDYADILNLREQLMQFKDAPAAWHSGELNIPITTNFKEYVDGFIDRKIWEFETIKKVSTENPDASVVRVFFPPSHPDKFLPALGKMTYVRQKPSGAMVTWGTMLTVEQRRNLLYKGIEPEGIEIVYIDEDYNVLSEKPKPFDRDKWREENSYDIVPEGLRAPDGTIVTPERYEELTGEPMSYKIRQKYDEYVETEPTVDR